MMRSVFASATRRLLKPRYHQQQKRCFTAHSTTSTAGANRFGWKAAAGAVAAGTIATSAIVYQKSAKADSAAASSGTTPAAASTKADFDQSVTSGVRRLKTTREIKERFNQFASAEKDGQKIMTFQDFCRSLSLDPSSTNAQALFGAADAHGDGGVSLADYASFVSMLHSSEAELRVAFSLFDLNHDGQISLDEFSKVVNARIAGPDFAFRLADTKLMRSFFGEDGNKKLNLRQFREVLDTLEKAVVEATFNRFDIEKKGSIPISRVVQYLDSQLINVPKHVREHLYARSAEIGAEGVTSDMFWALHYFLRDIDTIEAAMQSVIAKNGGRDTVTRQEFESAFSETAGHAVPVIADASGKESRSPTQSIDPREIEMIFRIFGNKNGTLDHRQFASWVKKSGKVNELPPMTLLESFGLSGIAAMIGASTVFPIDKVKTRLQTSNIPGATILSTARGIIEKEGVLRMYRGLQAQLVGITPEKALKLTSNQFFVDLLKGGQQRDLSFLENALSGVLTGCVQVSLTNPVEIVKIRLQMQKSGADVKSPIAVVRELGLRGLYTGLPATMLRDIPFK